MVTGGTPDDVIKTALSVRPSVVQLHYRETLDDISRIVTRLKTEGIKVVKALRIKTGGLCDFEIENPPEAARAIAGTGVSGILLDSFTETMPGGTGVTVDVASFLSVKEHSPVPVILAGGLNPDNIGVIIRTAAPFAVDVLTGVEIRPGLKDADKVRKFMSEVARHSRLHGTFGLIGNPDTIRNPDTMPGILIFCTICLICMGRLWLHNQSNSD